MGLPAIFVVDKNITVSQREQAAWMEQGIAADLSTATTADASART